MVRDEPGRIFCHLSLGTTKAEEYALVIANVRRYLQHSPLWRVLRYLLMHFLTALLLVVVNCAFWVVFAFRKFTTTSQPYFLAALWGCTGQLPRIQL